MDFPFRLSCGWCYGLAWFSSLKAAKRPHIKNTSSWPEPKMCQRTLWCLQGLSNSKGPNKRRFGIEQYNITRSGLSAPRDVNKSSRIDEIWQASLTVDSSWCRLYFCWEPSILKVTKAYSIVSFWQSFCYSEALHKTDIYAAFSEWSHLWYAITMS